MKKIACLVAAALLACTIISCHHNEAEEHEHHHGEQMTSYNDDFELFAEITPMVVGKDCGIAAHLTRLSNFKPLDSTKVTMKLTVGGKTQQVVLENPPKTAGIYKFEITPATAGDGTLMFEIATGDTLSILGFEHVEVFASKEDAEKHIHGEEEHEHEHSNAAANAITFTKEQSWKIDFATEVLNTERFGRVIRTSAQVAPASGDQRQVTAKAGGIVIFNNPNLVEGTKVSAGQRLFTVESSGMADNNMGVKFQEASAAYQLAKSEYERKQGLAEDKIVSQSELQRAKMEYESAKAVYNNLKNNFSSNGQYVSAPISGYVINVAVKNGGYVDAGQEIITISQNKDLTIKAEVSPRYYDDLAHVCGATIKPMNSNEIIDIPTNNGFTYGRTTNTGDPLIPITMKLNNNAHLVSGSFVTLYLRTEGADEVITIPNTGIVEDMGAYFVFVQINPEQFEKREVTLGATDGLRTVLSSGVKVGERVVSKGAIMVKLAAASGAIDPHAGHVH